MISPGTFTIRCDGIDHSTGDRCKSSVVLNVRLEEFSLMRNDLPGRISFFGARLPMTWSVVPRDSSILCPSCKP